VIKLYYSPGACSMASHIALEETGQPYEPKETSLATEAHKSPEYLKINPRGKVPALVVDDKVITENTAILTYVGKRFPQTGMWPEDPIEQVHVISQMAWFSNTPHISQREIMRPYRFVSQEAHYEDAKQTGRRTFWENLREIDELIGSRKWIMGNRYTMADPYSLVFYRWGLRAQMPMHELKSFTRVKNQLLERKAVKAVLQREKDTFLEAAA
jgi:glutathione S-transferase